MADSNKIQYGFRNLYYSVITKSADEVTYASPKAWKGAKSITLDAQGETQTYYADDVAYFTSSTNNGYSGTLEMSYLPDDVLKDIFGHVETSDGMLAEDANVLPKEVALIFEFQGDDKATRHILYDVVFGRAGTTGNTKEDAINPDTQSLNITVVPVTDEEGHAWTKAKATSTSTNYATIFTTAPTLPTVAEE